MTKNPFHFESDQEKQEYVDALFASIADRYDRMNRLMSLGRDKAWRRRAVQLAAVPPGGRLLDVAIGTGDLSLVALEHNPSVYAVGVDFNLQMMRFGRRKSWQRRNDWTNGDALRLPYPDDAFDAVISGFMMRNVTDVAAALAEQRRVVRRGRRVVCLELTRPQVPLWRELYHLFFGRMMPPITGLLSRRPSAYHYLPASVDSFMNVHELKAVMEAVGLRGVGYQAMMMGTVAIHVGVK
jgi:demethylmenaquinone methyltransferase/2-methoxy-6-polyprenyl-1,4-benzoquinol methylase